MNKKILIGIFSLLIVLYLGTTITLDIVREEGKAFSSHWWWISGLIILVICTGVLIVVWALKKLKKEPIQEEKQKEEKKSMGYYQKIVDDYWKQRLDDMYELEHGFAVPFPSIENPENIIVKGKGYNTGKTVFFAVGKNEVEYASPCEDISIFKEHLKPKLEAITETTEEEPFTGRKRSVRLTKPLIEEEIKKRIEEEEKQKEEERFESMETTKKEEK